MRTEKRTVTVSPGGTASNTPITTRDADDYIPSDVVKRVVTAVFVTDKSGAGNTVRIENYDAGDTTVDSEVILEVASNEEESAGDVVEKLLEILKVDTDGNHHQLTYSTPDGDCNLTIEFYDVLP